MASPTRMALGLIQATVYKPILCQREFRQDTNSTDNSMDARRHNPVYEIMLFHKQSGHPQAQ
jgi:hypothetical protein